MTRHILFNIMIYTLLMLGCSVLDSSDNVCSKNESTDVLSKYGSSYQDLSSKCTRYKEIVGFCVFEFKTDPASMYDIDLKNCIEQACISYKGNLINVKHEEIGVRGTTYSCVLDSVDSAIEIAKMNGISTFNVTFHEPPP